MHQKKTYTDVEIKARHDLIYWKEGQNSNNFTALLYLLICKADFVNKCKLESAFPEKFAAWSEWQESDDEKKLFSKWKSL